MISDSIQKIEREDISHEHSYFLITFQDGSIADERNTNWSSFSEERQAYMLERSKTVVVCTHPVKNIKIFHNGLIADLDVPEDCQVYQAQKSQAIFVNGAVKTMVIGRTVGLIREDKIVLERYLDGMSGNVVGVEV